MGIKLVIYFIVMEKPVKKNKRFTHFVGIDISKNKLDYAVMHGKNLLFHREGANIRNEIFAFIVELKSLPHFSIAKSVFCTEQTGIYGNHLLEALKAFKANIVVENALQIKNSLGLIRNKNDKLDSIRIAKYAQKNKDDLKFLRTRRPVLLQLANLYVLRERLLNVQKALTTPIKEQSTFVKQNISNKSQSICERSLSAIKTDLINVDKELDNIIINDERLNHLFKLITSVQFIGRITAIQIIISTNEFLDITSPKKFACYAGVAPFAKESGLKAGKAKVSHIANKKIKALLHICALSAINREGELKAYYLRKTGIEGKSKMSVINAVRNKLILRIFSCLSQDRTFEKCYASQFKKTLSLNE